MRSQWAKDAPAHLVRAYQDHEIRNGRVLLGRLLERRDWITSPWTQLSRRVQTDRQWLRVWSAIAYAKAKSKRAVRMPHKPRSEEHDDYRALAKKFAGLAKKIEDGPLDVLSYELWGQEDWAALQAPDLNEMAAQQRCDAAYQILDHWPSAVDLLHGLEKRALTLAKEAMIKRRPDARSRGDIELRTFVWHLGKEFRLIFGKELLGTLAIIADMAFDRGDEDEPTSRSFVQSVLRGV
jgi:hypothetical protein